MTIEKLSTDTGIGQHHRPITNQSVVNGMTVTGARRCVADLKVF